MGIPIAGRGYELLGTVVLFVALSSITMFMRIYCRVFLVKNFGLDDYLAVAAWITFSLFSAFAILGVHNGTGQHAWDIHPPETLPVGLKWWWACEPCYVASMMLLKASICVFLLRIAVAPLHKWIIWGVLLVHEVYSVFFFFIFVFQCVPATYFWTRFTGGKGKCINPKISVDVFYVYSAISCAGDWILGILPIFIVWKLQMNKRTKISVACILAVGAIASSATIIRIPYISGMANAADFLYATTDVAIWSTVEIGIGLTTSAAATLRPIFKAVLGSSTNASGKGSNMWAPSRDRPSGYIRSQGKGDGFMLRSDIGKGNTTTTIRGAGDEESLGRAGASRGHDSIEKLRGDSESDDWNAGIVKTTRVVHVRE